MIDVVDFHSHILPGIDDGSSSVEESVSMLKMAAEQGIRQMIATPHFYATQDYLERFLKRRKEAEKKLCDAMVEQPDLPRIAVGAEVLFFPGISETDSLTELTIAESNYILVEMPQSAWTGKMYRELEAIYRNYGITPIIAHVDRYLSPLNARGITERLMDLPVLVQANASFFLNRWTEGLAMRMMKKGQIHLLGSDCHNMRHRPPRLGEAVLRIQKRLGKDSMDTVMYWSEQILQDECIRK